jgi:CRP-like cAMP-binding protein
MNTEPMLLLQIAEERRRRLIDEAERERLLRRTPVTRRLATALRSLADRIDTPSPQGSTAASLP